MVEIYDLKSVPYINGKLDTKLMNCYDLKSVPYINGKLDTKLMNCIYTQVIREMNNYIEKLMNKLIVIYRYGTVDGM